LISSGEINGTPIHASKHLITDILKKRTGFSRMSLEGYYIIHKTQAENNRDAVKKQYWLI
jgi:beta-glucosidase